MWRERERERENRALLIHCCGSRHPSHRTVVTTVTTSYFMMPSIYPHTSNTTRLESVKVYVIPSTPPTHVATSILFPSWDEISVFLSKAL
jgi:hypothetical protein